MKAVTTASLLKMKHSGDKIVAITAYDASFAKLFDQAGVDVMLIGDSLGMVLKGESDTLAVTVDEIAYHVRCVANGATRSFVVADMPFMSYDTPANTYQNAAKLMASGASMVKLEGGEWLAETVKGLTERGVPVCGHLGLTPQSVHVFGGFKVQGRADAQAEKLLADALLLEASGAQMLVLECVPATLGKRVTEALSIPVIGIGAGKDTDGQILVMHDMLGVSANYMPKFSKNYLALNASLADAVTNYIDEVKQGVFPGPEHTFN
jgi:3-methyl-2-oxobutanoate hydroxymethyltransferase